MRPLNYVLAALIVYCLAALPGCVVQPHHAHVPRRSHAGSYACIPHHSPHRDACTSRGCRVFGELQHPLINTDGTPFLMSDHQFRSWQAPPTPPAETVLPPTGK